MEALRKCNNCGVEAYTRDDLEGFVVHKNYKYNRRNICKACDAYRVGIHIKGLEPKVIKERRRNAQYKAYYGITLLEYNIMLEKQDNCCYICNTHEDTHIKNLFVDHCHSTGKVRGLLCSNCNAGLGMFKDNTKLMENAIKYLQEKDHY